MPEPAFSCFFEYSDSLSELSDIVQAALLYNGIFEGYFEWIIASIVGVEPQKAPERGLLLECMKVFWA